MFINSCITVERQELSWWERYRGKIEEEEFRDTTLLWGHDGGLLASSDMQTHPLTVQQASQRIYLLLLFIMYLAEY